MPNSTKRIPKFTKSPIISFFDVLQNLDSLVFVLIDLLSSVAFKTVETR